jgi:transcriptional regulator with XRE-family HTH domain
VNHQVGAEPDWSVALRSSRLLAALTQEELAEAAGVGVRSIRDLETGRVLHPRPSTARLLSAALSEHGAPLYQAPEPGSAHASAVLDVVSEVLNSVDQPDDSRARFVNVLSRVFECDSVGYAWTDVTGALCLLLSRSRPGISGVSTLTLSHQDGAAGEGADSAWRLLVHDWMAAEFVTEVPLLDEPRHRSSIVLGRDEPFDRDAALFLATAQPHLAIVARVISQAERLGN